MIVIRHLIHSPQLDLDHILFLIQVIVLIAVIVAVELVVFVMMTLGEDEDDYLLGVGNRKGPFKKDSVTSISTLVPPGLSNQGLIKRTSRW